PCFPFHPKFWGGSNKTLVRRELGVAVIPTVLIMGCGLGLMFGKEVMDSLTARMDDIQLVFCMGSNEKLVAKMRANPLLNHPNVKILGYTSEINKLMDASDLLITKPGGMTCTEGQAKGIPMLFYSAIPGQEEKNCQYFVELGLAEELDSDVVDKWFSLLLREYAGLEELRRRRIAPDRQQPSHCASTVLQLLGKPGGMSPEPRGSLAAVAAAAAAQPRNEEAVYITP
ncbi:UDP-N-acetylglucosamine:LPS N-acetylglucosamine transferase, partial [Paenibacillus riograndensis]